MPRCRQRHHSADIESAARSPCGTYLATGSTSGPDMSDGHLILWDLRDGALLQCHPIPGGLGWPDRVGGIQWRPDGAVLGLTYSTNALGVLDPFDPDAAIRGRWRVTNGWPYPPRWIWSPDGAQIYVACWGPDSAMGCFLQVDEPDRPERWAFSAPELDTLSSLDWRAPDLVTGWVSWNRCVGIDTATGAMRWTREVVAPALHNAAGEPRLKPRWRYDHDTEVLIPSPDGRRVAALVRSASREATPGVHVFERGRRVAVLPAPLALLRPSIDAPCFAWSPDGRGGALLRKDGVLEVWALDGEPRRIAEVPVQGVRAVYYGANLGLVGTERILFLRPDGTEIAAYDNGPEIDEIEVGG